MGAPSVIAEKHRRMDQRDGREPSQVTVQVFSRARGVERGHAGPRYIVSRLPALVVKDEPERPDDAHPECHFTLLGPARGTKGGARCPTLR